MLIKHKVIHTVSSIPVIARKDKKVNNYIGLLKETTNLFIKICFIFYYERNKIKVNRSYKNSARNNIKLSRSF